MLMSNDRALYRLSCVAVYLGEFAACVGLTGVPGAALVEVLEIELLRVEEGPRGDLDYSTLRRRLQQRQQQLHQQEVP